MVEGELLDLSVNLAEPSRVLEGSPHVRMGSTLTMKFDANGYLDAGLHPTTLADIRTHFVDPFPAPSTRPTVYAGYERHTAELQKSSVEFEQFLDGSFVSNKQDPGDIDLLGMADLHAIDALPAAEKQRLHDLFLGPACKQTYECDAYFLPSVPDTDPAYPHFRRQRKYWMGEFGFDRMDRPKGILTIKVSPTAGALSTAGSAGTAAASPLSAIQSASP